MLCKGAHCTGLIIGMGGWIGEGRGEDGRQRMRGKRRGEENVGERRGGEVKVKRGKRRGGRMA